MGVAWVKCANQWCELNRVELQHHTLNAVAGVYIIWNGQSGRVVRVGQGVIRERLAAHRQDREVQAYANLLVTWAAVPTAQRDGVEKYLADSYDPLVGERFPDRLPLTVNLPT